MQEIILKSYKRDRDEALATSATRVVEGMDNNPDFPDPPPALAELTETLPDYRSAIAEAKGRSTLAVSRKKDLKAKVIGLLTELDAYVTSKSNGNRTMMISSGFYILGEKADIQEPTISELSVQLGAPGILTVSINRIANCRAYFHQYTTETPTSATSWHSVTNVVPKYTFSGLISGQTYWVRVAILSKSGQMIYSPVEARIVQ